VFVLLSNHELAQVNGEDIMKHGISSVEAFDDGLDYVFDEQAEEVRAALHEYVYSYPLAVRCNNGVFCSHSLPTPRKRERFDPMVINRHLTDTNKGVVASGGGVCGTSIKRIAKTPDDRLRKP
jgi:hypothetical protein